MEADIRILGIDPGTRRVGLALSDPLGLTAQPLMTIPAGPELLTELVALCRERGVTGIVIGLSRHMFGAEGELAAESRELAAGLEAQLGLPIVLWDERLTSAAADRAMFAMGVPRKKRKGRRDTIAAQMILQEYLDSSSQER